DAFAVAPNLKVIRGGKGACRQTVIAKRIYVSAVLAAKGPLVGIAEDANESAASLQQPAKGGVEFPDPEPRYVQRRVILKVTKAPRVSIVAYVKIQSAGIDERVVFENHRALAASSIADAPPAARFIDNARAFDGHFTF